MSIFMRFFWLVTLLFFAGGCSSYKAVSAPHINDDVGMAHAWESSVKVGDMVRITLADNSEVEGKIMALSSETLALEGDETTKSIDFLGDLSVYYQPRVIAVESILVVELQEHSSSKTFLLVSGIIVGCVGILGILFASSGEFNVGMVQ